MPLFPHDSTLIDADETHVYFQVLHAGYEKIPESIVAVIPSRDQQAIIAGMLLPIMQPSVAAIEQVKEEMHIKLVNSSQGNAEQKDSTG